MTLGLIGLKKDLNIGIREKFTVIECEKKEYLNTLLNKNFDEVIILSTCNRIEIYIRYDKLEDDEIYDIIFDTFSWSKDLYKYTFLKKDEEVSKHLFEVACGYHSKILGEDQILGQIRDAYLQSLKCKAAKHILARMFEDAISCSKSFKTMARLYEIPVSSISIVVEKFRERKCRNIMVLGYGNVGKLAVKYLKKSNAERIYVVVRNKDSAKDIDDERIKVITFKEKNKYINDMDGIIGCTAAPHAVVLNGDIKEYGKDIYCFDMAVPRDIHKDVLNLDRIKAYNIDEISSINDKNKSLRQERMNSFKYIVNEKLKSFNEYLKYREISKDIKKIKENSDEVYLRRYKTYTNKRENFYNEDLTKDYSSDLEGIKENRDEKIVRMLLKSTSDYYLHRAIEVLKEEKLKGCEEECLDIIERIFKKEQK